MKIPPFWARATDGEATAFGWSFLHPQEAEEHARKRARQTAERIAAGTLRDAKNRYYADRPLKEPILKELRSADGSIAALLTRNAPGCLVLNAAKALFVDVDFPPAPKPLETGGFLALIGRLFGKPAPKPPAVVDPMDAILRRAKEWMANHPGWQWRVYRTKAGARLLATHALFDTTSPETEQVFGWLGADPLYRKLCTVQQCFRARLTPKPWRCDYPDSPSAWPFADDAAQDRHVKWEAGYLERCQTHATCELVEAGGDSHPDLQEMITLHDATTRVGSGLPLA